jgi:hypothetical protein
MIDVPFRLEKETSIDSNVKHQNKDVKTMFNNLM